MHVKVRSRGSHFGMHWDPANVALTLMLVLLFLIFLLLFMSLTAQPALGQAPPVNAYLEGHQDSMSCAVGSYIRHAGVKDVLASSFSSTTIGR